MIVIAPSESNLPVDALGRLSRTNRRVKASTARPTGMLTKKIHSQPRYFVRMPPASTPTAAPEPPTAPQTPSALLRSAPSVNVVETIERPAGEIDRGAEALHGAGGDQPLSLVASPQTNEAAVNRMSPIMKIAPAPEQVGRPAAEQQEAAERDRVGRDHPLQLRLARS